MGLVISTWWPSVPSALMPTESPFGYWDCRCEVMRSFGSSASPRERGRCRHLGVSSRERLRSLCSLLVGAAEMGSTLRSDFFLFSFRVAVSRDCGRPACLSHLCCRHPTSALGPPVPGISDSALLRRTQSKWGASSVLLATLVLQRLSLQIRGRWWSPTGVSLT